MTPEVLTANLRRTEVLTTNCFSIQKPPTLLGSLDRRAVEAWRQVFLKIYGCDRPFLSLAAPMQKGADRLLLPLTLTKLHY